MRHCSRVCLVAHRWTTCRWPWYSDRSAESPEQGHSAEGRAQSRRTREHAYATTCRCLSSVRCTPPPFPCADLRRSVPPCDDVLCELSSQLLRLRQADLLRRHLSLLLQLGRAGQQVRLLARCSRDLV